MYSENMKACLMFAHMRRVRRSQVSVCVSPPARVIRTPTAGGSGGGNLTLSDYDLQVKMVGSPILQAQIIFKASLN